jgi:FKBP-type peptidyl-prolyl cis-trans isomerase (trigger factor)
VAQSSERDAVEKESAPPRNNLHWESERLDEGRMLLVRISMDAESIREEVAARLADLGRRAPPKGFRAGKVAETVLRRVYGKKVLDAVRNDLMTRSFQTVIAECAKQGVEARPGSQFTPTNLVFSEEAGLKYEIIFTGLEPKSGQSAPRGDTVDLRK